MAGTEGSGHLTASDASDADFEPSQALSDSDFNLDEESETSEFDAIGSCSSFNDVKADLEQMVDSQSFGPQQPRLPPDLPAIVKVPRVTIMWPNMTVLTQSQRDLLSTQLAAHMQLLILTYLGLATRVNSVGGPLPSEPCWSLIYDFDNLARKMDSLQTATSDVWLRSRPPWFGSAAIEDSVCSMGEIGSPLQNSHRTTVFSKCDRLRKLLPLIQAFVKQRAGGFGSRRCLPPGAIFDVFQMLVPDLDPYLTVSPYALEVTPKSAPQAPTPGESRAILLLSVMGNGNEGLEPRAIARLLNMPLSVVENVLADHGHS